MTMNLPIFVLLREALKIPGLNVAGVFPAETSI